MTSSFGTVLVYYGFDIYDFEVRIWAFFDLVAQFWRNFVSETFGMIAMKMTLLFLNTLSCDVIIWSRFLLIIWYKNSLNIKRDYSFVLVPCHSCY